MRDSIRKVQSHDGWLAGKGVMLEPFEAAATTVAS
jgi:hypothetical protein